MARRAASSAVRFAVSMKVRGAVGKWLSYVALIGTRSGGYATRHAVIT